MALRVTKAASVISSRSSYYRQASIASVESLLYKFPPLYLPMAQPRRSRKVLPAVMMRSGTSKGLFLHKKDLPKDRSEWGNILLSAMGSRDGDLRQLDGVGGATSTTSKVAVVSKSNMPGIDVEYTFVQIGVGSNKVDFSGNCGNICSGVGPFAVDESLVVPVPGQNEIDVHIFNTNTSRKIVQRVQVGPDGLFREDGDYKMGGVKGTASEIKVTFVDPAGSMTDKLFPTGSRMETLVIDSSFGEVRVSASMVDAANPFVFVDAASLPYAWHTLERNDPTALELIEKIRCTAAVKMGLAIDEGSAHLVRGTPKISVLSSAALESNLSDSKAPEDIRVTSYSMGKMHPSFQLTGAVCLGAAVCVPGTVAAEIKKRRALNTPPGTPPSLDPPEGTLLKPEQRVVIAHPSGEIEVDVNAAEKLDGEFRVEGVTVSRTARRLFEGGVLINV